MNSTGHRNSIAAFAEILLAVCGCAHAFAAECSNAAIDPQKLKERLQELNNAAQAEMQRQRFHDAVTYFQEIACLAPKNAQAFYNLGAAQAASGDLAAARRSFTTSAGLDPVNPLPMVMLVRVNVSLAGMDSLKSVLRVIALRFPDDGELHGLLARFLTEKNQLDLALAESLRSVRARGADGGSKVALAILENAVGAYQEAIANALAVTRQANLPNPTRAAAAGVAGLSYEGLGKRDEAVVQMRESIRLDPARENSYLALAFLLEKAQKYADAVTVLEQGRRNVPDSRAFLLPLGSDLVRAEKYDAAIDILREVVRQSPDEADAYLRMADAFRKTGSPDREVEVLRELSKRKPKYPMVHVLIVRAMLNCAQPDYAKALEELDSAEEASPSDADVFYLRGKVYIETFHNEDAVAALLRAIELRPMDSGPYYQLGRLYQKLGKTELAKEQFDRMKFLLEGVAAIAKEK